MAKRRTQNEHPYEASRTALLEIGYKVIQERLEVTVLRLETDDSPVVRTIFLTRTGKTCAGMFYKHRKGDKKMQNTACVDGASSAGVILGFAGL